MEFAVVGAGIVVALIGLTLIICSASAKAKAHELALKQLDIQQSADDRATAEATLRIKQLEAQAAEDNRLAAQAALTREREAQSRPRSWS